MGSACFAETLNCAPLYVLSPHGTLLSKKFGCSVVSETFNLLVSSHPLRTSDSPYKYTSSFSVLKFAFLSGS